MKTNIIKSTMLLLLGTLFVSSNASAIVITSGGGAQNFSVNFNGNVNSTPIPGLSAKADFSLVSVSGATWTFDVSLENLTTNLFQSARASLLGFATDPNVVSGSVSGVFNQVRFGSINANGGIPTEVCFKDGGGNNCNGGGSGGVTKGNTGTFQIVLNFGSVVNSLTLSDFGIRWQSLDSTTYNIRGGSGTGTGTAQFTPTGVPAPGLLGLVGLGLIGIAAARRRKA